MELQSPSARWFLFQTPTKMGWCKWKPCEWFYMPIRRRSILWAQFRLESITILHKMRTIVWFTLLFKPLVWGWYRVVFRYLMLKSSIKSIMASFKKWEPRSLIKIFGQPNCEMMFSWRKITVYLASANWPLWLPPIWSSIQSPQQRIAFPLKRLDEWAQCNLCPTSQRAQKGKKDLVGDPSEDHFDHNVGKHHIASYGILH